MNAPFLASDDVGKFNLKREFLKARKAEAGFSAQLRKIAKHIVDLARGFDLENPIGLAFFQAALIQYANVLDPWARNVSAKMIAEVAQRDRRAWANVSTRMGIEMRAELNAAPMGQVMAELQEIQTQLIKSIPTEAAVKVHEWTQEGLSTGARAKTVADRIFNEIGGVTRSRAMLIARTETTRTAGAVMQARAQSVGSTHYTWQTMHDADVRPDHRILDGKVFAWAEPPIADQRTGARAPPGAIYNCRCLALPILPAD